MLLISQGTLGGKPDFGGIAIGDTLLENFEDARLGVWFKEGDGNSRIKKDDYLTVKGKKVGDLKGVTIPTDVFSVKRYEDNKYFPWLSGARTPGTGTEFGLFNITPNCNHYKVDYELILVNDNLEQDVKEGQREKINKRDSEYPVGAGITEVQRGFGSSEQKWKVTDFSSPNPEFTVRLDDKIRYVIRKDKSFGSYQGGRWDWTIINATSQRRAAADDTIALGRIYHIAQHGLSAPTSQMKCGTQFIYSRLYPKCVDPGVIRLGDPTKEVDNWRTYNLAELSYGSITTNRPDEDFIDIGIKSTVWKRVSASPTSTLNPSSQLLTSIQTVEGAFSSAQ